jgi:hypothetical protein
MAEKFRHTLKGFFETGKIPTQAQYADLIDSNLNLSDVGVQIIKGTISASVISIPGFSNLSSSLAAAIAGGDNLGNHTAIQNLLMEGFSIQNALHITSSGNISASGLLFISASQNAGQTYEVLVRDPSTGRVYHTGSYGEGGGGGGFTAADISGSWQGQNFISASQTFLSTGQRSGNSVITGSLFLVGSSGHLTASGNISASNNIIGSKGYFSQTIITLNSTDLAAEASPFLISIADNNGQDEKLQVNHEGVLRFGALTTLPTAITGGLVYSENNFYMGVL